MLVHLVVRPVSQFIFSTSCLYHSFIHSLYKKRETKSKKCFLYFPTLYSFRIHSNFTPLLCTIPLHASVRSCRGKQKSIALLSRTLRSFTDFCLSRPSQDSLWYARMHSLAFCFGFLIISMRIVYSQSGTSHTIHFIPFRNQSKFVINFSKSKAHAPPSTPL